MSRKTIKSLPDSITSMHWMPLYSTYTRVQALVLPSHTLKRVGICASAYHICHMICSAVFSPVSKHLSMLCVEVCFAMGDPTRNAPSPFYSFVTGQWLSFGVNSATIAYSTLPCHSPSHGRVTDQ